MLLALVLARNQLFNLLPDARRTTITTTTTTTTHPLRPIDLVNLLQRIPTSAEQRVHHVGKILPALGAHPERC